MKTQYKTELQPEKNNQEKQNLSELIGRLIRQLNIFNRDQVVCYGVTLSQCYVLESLNRKGKLTMNELSQEQSVTLSTMTRIVDVLVRDEIVLRTASPDDRRKVFIELTQKGKKLADELKICTEEFVVKLLEKVPQEKRDQVVESMHLLSQAIDTFNFRCNC